VAVMLGVVILQAMILIIVFAQVISDEQLFEKAGDDSQ
jgi:hypothetical protein